MARIGAPISSNARASTGARLLLGAFFSVFFLMGSGFLYFVFIKPMARIVSAREWPSTSCQILASRVHTTSDSDGDTYRVDVRYRYTVDGRNYTSDQYRFMRFSSSGYAGKAAAVARLAPGTRTDCYYDPADPSDAVINRGFTGDLFFGIIPLVFVVVGAGGILAAILGGRSGRGPRWVSAMSGAPKRQSGSFMAYEQPSRRPRPTILQPKQTRRAKLVGFTLIAAFWNVIVFVIVYQSVGGWSRGSTDWPNALLMIPFALIGIGLVVFAVRQAMLLANPTPILTVSGEAIPLGDEFKITWAIDGKASALGSLRIDLEGREEATYRRGTYTRTDTQIFAKLPLVDVSSPVSDSGGVVRLTIPADTMHSFEAPHNKIVWLLRVHGEVPNWPDSNEEYPLTIAPRRR